ncbi:MAG TPA: hypothetical protein VGL03_07135 [Thermoanaerobaculia bacterium]|jgi:hypothetical protein
MNTDDAPRPSSGILFALSLAAVGAAYAAYSNHFHNSFHFDDATVIENNAYVRSLRNIPLFFADATISRAIRFAPIFAAYLNPFSFFPRLVILDARRDIGCQAASLRR